MKKIIAFIITLISFSGAFAQNSFEGKVVLKAENTATGEVSAITWYMKNGQHLLNYVNTAPKLNSTYSLVSTGGKLEMVNEKGRLEIPAASIKNADYNFSQYKLLNKEGGKVVNEFECIKYTIESGDKIAEYWITDYKGLSPADFPAFMSSGLVPVAEKLQAGDVPVQIKVSERNGKMLYQQTISYIMPCKVDDAKFK